MGKSCRNILKILKAEPITFHKFKSLWRNSQRSQLMLRLIALNDSLKGIFAVAPVSAPSESLHNPTPKGKDMTFLYSQAVTILS
ncbi:hypothetical protein E2C01_100318 [Portunus trituberculatus]|uniref:Uncharacterized protein n=1 Tax=Portunus trituberculatus TaxID=210409 RepID=A0A5B7K6P4_PORTR|nr:hypothetical protein [Portunus trituberculatus]